MARNRTLIGTLAATLMLGAAVSAAGLDRIDGAATVAKAAVRVPSAARGTESALSVLDTIQVRNEPPAGYDRSLFGYPSSQGNGCDTRARVLERDSRTPAQIAYPGSVVLAGDWTSSYDNLNTSDPTDLEIDHLVALKEAWDSGANTWSNARRVAFGNDLTDARTLRAVTTATNRSKGDADPSNWLPPYQPHVCTYLADWISIKARWGLAADQSEHGRIRNVITSDCPGLRIAPWTAAPNAVDPPPPPTTTNPSTCHPSYPTVCITPPPPDLNCGDIPYRNFTVLQPDPHGFDGNNDGVGCQS